MHNKKRHLLRLLAIILLNICALGLAGHMLPGGRSVSALPDVSPDADEKRIIQSTADSDYYLLARLIEAESTGEPYTGQVAVGAVVLNRVRRASFPDSIAGVIYQSGAFASVTDGRIDASAGPQAFRAAGDALNGLDPSGGALYYYSTVESGRGRLEERTAVKIIGSRTFCK